MSDHTQALVWHLAMRALCSKGTRHNHYCTTALSGCRLHVFTLVSCLFCSCSVSGISFPAATFFGSCNVASFHSPVHDGSVDVDEIDEDSKVEDALDADEASLRLVATK